MSAIIIDEAGSERPALLTGHHRDGDNASRNTAPGQLWERVTERRPLAMHEAVRIRRAVKRVREVRRENAAREATTYPHHGAPVMLDSSSRSGVICAGVRVI